MVSQDLSLKNPKKKKNIKKLNKTSFVIFKFTKMYETNADYKMRN